MGWLATSLTPVGQGFAKDADLTRAVGAQVGPVEERGGHPDHKAHHSGPDEGAEVVMSEREVEDHHGPSDRGGPEGDEPEAEVREHASFPTRDW